MGGTTSQQTQQNSQTQPWANSIPMLNTILGQLGQGNVGPTGGQTGAVNQIMGEAGGVPGFGGQGVNTVNNLFGANTTPQQDILKGAYGQSSDALKTMLSKNYLDPSTNPYLGPAMSTLNSDITNQIAGQFASAGRPLGTNAAGTQALARGLSQGESGMLANEFNTLAGQQQNAANLLPSIAGSTAGGLTAQQNAQLMNELQGMQASGALPGMFTQPGTSMLNAANLQAGLPWANLAQLEGMTVPIAGLGAQSTGQSTTQQTSPWWTTALGLGMMGASMFSDERVKEDISQVGMLYDETPVFSYRYKGDPTPRIGLMAQDIEKRRPDAVAEFGGIKAVDYGKATERARMIGMLADLDMAA